MRVVQGTEASVDAAAVSAAVAAHVSGKPVAFSRPAGVAMQSAFLVTLAVENGLKALLAADRQAMRVVAQDGELPGMFKTHDLEDLARRGGFATVDPAELEVLRAGQMVIEHLGRYPEATAAPETPTVVTVRPLEVASACERIFLKCVEEATRRAWMAGPEKVAEVVARYRDQIGAVPTPLPGRLLVGWAKASMRTVGGGQAASVAFPLKR